MTTRVLKFTENIEFMDEEFKRPNRKKSLRYGYNNGNKLITRGNFHYDDFDAYRMA